MHKLLNTASALVVGAVVAAGAAGSASAMTASPIPTTGDTPVVTLVSGGCGIYAHRTVYGACRPNIVGYRYGYGYRGVGLRGFYGVYRGYGWHHGYGWHRGW